MAGLIRRLLHPHELKLVAARPGMISECTACQSPLTIPLLIIDILSCTGNLLLKAWTSRYSNSVTSTAEVDDDNLPFNEMVLKFAEKVYIAEGQVRMNATYSCKFALMQATHIVVDKLVQSDKSNKPEEVKRRDVQGILNLILPCHATLHISFPIHRYVIMVTILTIDSAP